MEYLEPSIEWRRAGPREHRVTVWRVGEYAWELDQCRLMQQASPSTLATQECYQNYYGSPEWLALQAAGLAHRLLPSELSAGIVSRLLTDLGL